MEKESFNVAGGEAAETDAKHAVSVAEAAVVSDREDR